VTRQSQPVCIIVGELGRKSPGQNLAAAKPQLQLHAHTMYGMNLLLSFM